MPFGASAPCSTMSLKAACRPVLSLRKSGVVLGPKTWQREHSSMNLISPALMLAALAVCGGGSGIGASMRSGGVGTAPPPSLNAMMRLVFWYLSAALLGGIGPTVIAEPP